MHCIHLSVLDQLFWLIVGISVVLVLLIRVRFKMLGGIGTNPYITNSPLNSNHLVKAQLTIKY